MLFFICICIFYFIFLFFCLYFFGGVIFFIGSVNDINGAVIIDIHVFYVRTWHMPTYTHVLKEITFVGHQNHALPSACHNA